MSEKLEALTDGDVNDDVDDIDEAQEEALLKSDEDDGDDPMDTNENEESDDDDEEDEEARLIKVYIETLAQIDQNKYGYENYVQLIEIAHKLSDLEKIRQSYELFSSVYPVAPELWLKLLKIENSLASSETEVAECEKLFRKALDDYFCPHVALEFANFATKSTNADQLWAELVAVYALHPMHGRKIVELWKKFMATKEDSPDKLQNIQKTYEKLLTIPMQDMEETYIEFKVYAERNQLTVDWEHLDKRYNRAKSHLQKMLPFETKLSTLDAKYHQNRASLYKEYVQEADRFADESVLQILYERMVTECCLNPVCWLDYITYLERRDKYSRPEELEDFPVFEQTAMQVINRALRNCTWSDQLFIRKMRLAERLEMGKEEVKEIFEQGLEAGFQTPEPLVALWLEYLSYLARNTNFDEEKEAEVLRANFDFAWTSLGKQWGVLADCNCEILQLWGQLEYGPLKDPSKGKELWTTVMESSDNPAKSALWMEFIHLELAKGVDAGRKIYRKALNAETIDNPNTIASSWLRFERVHGTIEQIAACQEHCESILSSFVYRQAKAELQRPNKLKPDEKTKGKVAVGGKKRKTNETQDETSPTKRTKNEGSSKKSDKASTSDTSEIDPSKDHLRVFLSNLDYNITEDEIKESFPELDIAHIHLIRGASGKSRGFGYVEFSSAAEVQKALGFDRRKLKDRPVYISTVLRDKEQRQKFKYSDRFEPTKLFVKGIPYSSTNEDLEAIFSPHGKLKEVRIVYHKSGKPKGIAYVEFVDEASASKAVMKLDQTEIDGHKINVALSNPPKIRTASSDEPNIKKLLSSVGIRPAVNRGEQKPRLTLIPTVVRKNVLSAGTMAPPPPVATNGSADKPKSNADFRKLLNN